MTVAAVTARAMSAAKGRRPRRRRRAGGRGASWSTVYSSPGGPRTNVSVPGRGQASSTDVGTGLTGRALDTAGGQVWLPGDEASGHRGGGPSNEGLTEPIPTGTARI